jgi:hypothetical protein
MREPVRQRGSIARALERMPQSRRGHGIRFTGLRPTIRSLVGRGMLVPRGSGWDVGYVVTADLVERGKVVAGTVDGREASGAREKRARLRR